MSFSNTCGTFSKRGTLAALALLGLVAFPQAAWAQVTLFDNGTLVTGIGDGFGGANTSTIFAGHDFFGVTVNNSIARLAEDFTVSGGSWDLTELHWYAYQTGSTTTSTFTSAFVTIFDGVPGVPGTNVVAGDFSTNRLTSSAFSNIYRVFDSGSLTNTQRPVMDLTVDMSWVPDLVPGTYWLGVGATGSLGSGPFSPLRAVTYGASNLMQLDGGTGTWATVDVSSSAGTQATEASFQLAGNIVGAPEPGTLALGIAGGLAIKRRK